VNIVLYDDHQMFAEAFAVVLANRGWTVCALAFTPEQAEIAIVRHRPDVALIDVGLPAEESLTLVRAVCERAPATRVVLLTATADTADRTLISAATAAGASGFTSKMHDVDRVVGTVERVGRGERTIDSALVDCAARYHRRPRSERDVIEQALTCRERAVLTGLVRGRSTAELATELGITVNTTRTHIQNMLNKLGVHSRLEAAAFAVRAGHVAYRSN
jgi:DNA-binding NarL/FixJ family response regulator